MNADWLRLSCCSTSRAYKSLLTPELALQKTRQVSEQSNSFVICLLVFGDKCGNGLQPRDRAARTLAGSSVIAFLYFMGADSSMFFSKARSVLLAITIAGLA